MNTFNDGTYSLVTMFKANYFTPFLRRRVYGLEDVLSSIGGFTGLILGASVMTLIEIIYFTVIPNYKPKQSSVEQKPGKKILETFGELSSIHGINHAFSINRSSCDKLSVSRGFDNEKMISFYLRIAWSITLLISMAFCGWWIAKIYLNFESNLVHYVIDEKFWNVEDVTKTQNQLIKIF
jgi:hypothetical protein